MRRKQFIIAVTLLLVAAASLAMSTAPMLIGPPAKVEMVVEDWGGHNIYISRAPSTETYHHGPINIYLSLTQSNSFAVEVANVQLPDGRILFNVRVALDAESNYSIRVVDRGDYPGRLLFSGKLNEIPRVKRVQPQ